ncbi:M23 family metallopeptidase, partial [Anaerolineales bacterium HSG6]|nr:M23 family metallopeptidase [Anaerolineales bacterium HSG6]
RPWRPTPAPRIIAVPTDTLPNEALESHLWFGRPFPDYGAWGSFQYPYGSNSKGNFLWHYGIDVQASFGNTILTIGDGVVIHAGPDDLEHLLGPWPDFYGQAVVIEHASWHDQPVYSLYGHVSKLLVAEGQTVTKDDPIAKVGSGGVALGAHLHVEVRVGANSYSHTRNPNLWIRPDRGYGALAGRVMDANGFFVPVQLITLQHPETPKNYWRETYTYPNDQVNYDDMYVENFVIGDVPVGDYILKAKVDGQAISMTVSIPPREVTFVTLQSPLENED